MEEMFSRGWDELIARDSGPLHFRIVIQPIVATILAIRSGFKSVRGGQPEWSWTLLDQPAQRQVLLRTLKRDVGQLFLVACGLDVVYQLLVLRWIYPLQTLLVGMVLTIVPFLLVRGLARRLLSRRGSNASQWEGES